MTNSEPTLKQKQLIRLWLYSPGPAAAITMTIALLIEPRHYGPGSFMVLIAISLISIAIARKVETSRPAVLPSREDKTFLIFFAVFFISAKVGASFLFGHNDWALDLVAYLFAFLVISPYILYFRKPKREPTVAIELEKP